MVTGRAQSHARARPHPAVHRPLVCRATKLIGAVFLLIGILGFIPGVTTGYGYLRFAGHLSDAKLFGVFQVSVLHNIVHILFGIAGLALARTVAGAALFLVGGGAAYLVLWLYGLVAGHGPGAANVIPFNTADNWLHLALGIGMIGIGVATTRGRARRIRRRP
jgi:hypothetical protein